MNEILKVSTEKDMVEAHRIWIYKNNTNFWANVLPWEIQDLIQHTVLNIYIASFFSKYTK